MLMDGTGGSKSIGDGNCFDDGGMGRRTLLDRRTPTLAETDSCFPTGSLCHPAAVDGLIKLDSSENIWETIPASDGHGSLGCTMIAW